MNSKEIPQEVQMVWAFEKLKIPVGMEMYKKFIAISEEYPEYFGEDHDRQVRKYHKEQEQMRKARTVRDKILWDELEKLFKPHSIWKTMKNKLTPPSKVEQEYTFTHTELERILWLFGTGIAVAAQERASREDIPTCHTDAWVIPAVKKEMNNIREYYGQ